MLTFHRETWCDFAADPRALELWEEHYGELAGDKRMPMGPDPSFYIAAELGGMLELTTARKEGFLVGYCLVVVKPHPHYRTVLCGFEDAYFLRRSERLGSAGMRFLQEVLSRLRSRGVKRVFFMTKLSLDLLALFEHLGFAETDRVVSLWLGED